MRRSHLSAILALTLVLSTTGVAWARTSPSMPPPPRGPVRPHVANPNAMNRVHNAGKMCMNITNWGYFGNNSITQQDADDDPCPPRNWAPQCEYPCGSSQQYLYMAALWVGALIVEQGYETKRVSVGADGWNADINEMWPGEGAANGIIERSTRPGQTNCLGQFVSSPDAISDQDFVSLYADTLTDDTWLNDDQIDGKHRPLGIKITQTSYSFSQAFAEDFILIDYEFENIASNFLKNLYVGLYVDSDVGVAGTLEEHTDDICGFLTSTTDSTGQGTVVTIPIDVAWIADNDGRPHNVSGGSFTVPNVTGTRVIRGPNPRLTTSFNWWISNGDVNLDYGPSWEAYCSRDSMGMGWTRLFGTPMGDERKYQVMSNGEFDFWQIMVDRMSLVEPQRYVRGPNDTLIQNWCNDDPSPDATDIADGYDTRYLLSWGPLGVRDYQDQSGRWIYRLNPGEKFNMTIAYVGGENFHDPNRQQPSNTNIDSSLFNYADLKENARWAKDVYDNRMFDTPQYDWGNDHDESIRDDDGSQGDGILETGDGWYGEDVGQDGIFIEPPAGFVAGRDSVPVYYFKGIETINAKRGIFAGYYRGPDDGERDGVISQVTNTNLFPGGSGFEDNIMPEDLVYYHPRLRYWDQGWMSGNGLMDMGDGLPDFTGPPPPPVPSLLHCVKNTYNSSAHVGGVVKGGCNIGGLGYELREEKIVLRWSKKASESPDYRDPFSRVQDFEGYRIHVGNINEESSYDLLAEFDLIDYAYFNRNDSMMTNPWPSMEGLPRDSAFGDPAHPTWGYLKPVGRNVGFGGIRMDDPLDDSTYQYVIAAHTLAPRYFAVTAFDYGDPKSGLGPLSTRPTANAVLLAPTGSPKDPVRVVPNPYRAYAEGYRRGNLGISWENQNDGTSEFFPQVDRRIEFTNLPDLCLIRIFTVAGDLVAILPHNVAGDKSHWASPNSEAWDLNSRNRQQVVSGIYLFSVENLTEGHGYEIETGKFVIIR